MPKKQRHQEVRKQNSIFLFCFYKINFLQITPIAINKSIKNAVEIEGFINCHIRDGLALCQYFAWLEQMVLNKQYVDEISGADKLEEFRSSVLK